MKQIKKILVANRGEIAVRIIRSLQEMKIKTVAVYSDADTNSLAVQLADEAYHLGSSEPSQSYLNVEKIIKAAKTTQADAIHPGYGFLSENAAFASKVEQNDMFFIGPPPEVISRLGCKTRARKIMQKIGIPLVPGTLVPIENKKDLFVTADRIGFPLLLKASAGGGGKGMRKVHHQDELEAAFDRARSEAQTSFGNDAIYIEKVIEPAHHIEIQVVADLYGDMVCLGERECSVQRRYQKILEETPSPFIDNKTARRMQETALQVARAVNFKGVGSVEFIVDEDHKYYFLEVNPRLQVEHTITEMVTGIDIVKEQVKIARGEPLALSQDDINCKGAAIECRVSAEDPENNFMPSPGTIIEYCSPSGNGVRHDGGVSSGHEVSIFYDPLIAKLIIWGHNRPDVIKRMKDALNEYRVSGIKTTIPYFLKLLENDEFLSGNYTTDLVEKAASVYAN